MGGCSRSATPGVGLARGARLSTRRTLARHALPQRRHLYRPLERNLDSRAPRSLRAIPPVLEWVQTQALNGPPHYYFLYLLSAGCGVPVSEDALVCWIGSNLALNKYGSVLKNLVVLVWVYFGVVLSDMITFYIGVTANRGLLRRFFPNWGTSKNGVRAKREVERFGSKIGFVQRFFIGFRGPLCLCSGIAGAKPSSFFLGTCAGALLSISCQLLVGSVLRNARPNTYIATLALVAVPTLIGNVIGPLSVTISGYLLRRKVEGVSTTTT